jgi:hypothetical protein
MPSTVQQEDTLSVPRMKAESLIIIAPSVLFLKDASYGIWIEVHTRSTTKPVEERVLL